MDDLGKPISTTAKQNSLGPELVEAATTLTTRVGLTASPCLTRPIGQGHTTG
jgi:hypothetical protein